MKTPKEIIKPVRRQKERAALTRERILSSAQRIFVSDGFEAAKLDEIASTAGYTRGAFYANFKNKEELFVAVAGQQITNHISIAVGAVRSKSGVIPKVHELLQKMANTPESRDWVILMIEFSLFVLRHPEQKNISFCFMNHLSRVLRPFSGISIRRLIVIRPSISHRSLILLFYPRTYIAGDAERQSGNAKSYSRPTKDLSSC